MKKTRIFSLQRHKLLPIQRNKYNEYVKMLSRHSIELV